MNANFLYRLTNLLLFIVLGIGQIQAQGGCTDAQANNFNSEVLQNDGSCTYDPELISKVNSFSLDGKISGTSGLIYWDGNLWTHNDHDDTNLYKLDPTDGSITGSISLAAETNLDWEEISQDKDYIYIGDFGNNVNGNRKDLKILKVSKTSISAEMPDIKTINFTYKDQTDYSEKGSNNTNYDCEAFIITDNAIFLFTKEWGSNKTRLYKLPKTPGNHQAELQDTYDIKGLVTGAVYSKEKKIIALSGYNKFLQPFIFLLYDFLEDDFFGGNKRKLNLDLPFYQVEGIATDDGLNYFLSNERFVLTGTPQQLHKVDLSPYLEK